MLIDADDWCLLLDNAEIIFSSHLKNFNFVSFKIKKRNLWKSSFMKCCSLWIFFIIMWKIINTYNFCRGLVEFYSNLCRGSYALSSNGWKNFMHSFFFFRNTRLPSYYFAIYFFEIFNLSQPSAYASHVLN